MSARILQGSVFDVLPTIEPGSIDCAVTSPPYFALRSYLPKGHPLKHLELGSEKSVEAYINNMVRVFRLVRECLSPWGTSFINIGDTYAQSQQGRRRHGAGLKPCANIANPGERMDTGIDAGNLCLIPQRLALALQSDGWIVRSIIVWQKSAPMPQSVCGWQWRKCRVKIRTLRKETGKLAAVGHRDGPGCGIGLAGTPSTEWSDCPGCPKCEPHGGFVLRRGSWRPTSSYEPVLMLAKSKQYFADGIPVQTKAAAATISRDQYTQILDDPEEQFAVQHDHETVSDGGANLRDVWRVNLEDMSKEELIGLIQSWDTGEMRDTVKIAAEPLKAAHYAAFPTNLVRMALMAGVSAKGYCPTCGAPWARMVESATGGTIGKGSWVNHDKDAEVGVSSTPGKNEHDNNDYRPGKTIGWRQTCSCPPHEPRPGRVLDPFCGSGRTGIAAIRLGLDFTGVEINPEYVLMSERILRDESPLFA